MKRNLCGLITCSIDMLNMPIQPVPLVHNSTDVWKRMWSVRRKVEQNIFWIPDRGDIDVFLDKWVPFDIPMMNDKSKSSLFGYK